MIEARQKIIIIKTIEKLVLVEMKAKLFIAVIIM